MSMSMASESAVNGGQPVVPPMLTPGCNVVPAIPAPQGCGIAALNIVPVNYDGISRVDTTLTSNNNSSNSSVLNLQADELDNLPNEFIELVNEFEKNAELEAMNSRPNVDSTLHMEGAHVSNLESNDSLFDIPLVYDVPPLLTPLGPDDNDDVSMAEAPTKPSLPSGASEMKTINKAPPKDGRTHKRIINKQKKQTPQILKTLLSRPTGEPRRSVTVNKPPAEDRNNVDPQLSCFSRPQEKHIIKSFFDLYMGVKREKKAKLQAFQQADGELHRLRKELKRLEATVEQRRRELKEAEVKEKEIEEGIKKIFEL